MAVVDTTIAWTQAKHTFFVFKRAYGNDMQNVSSTGYGGYTAEYSCHIAHGPWTIEEVAQSSA